MNELDCIIKEVHDSLYNTSELSDDIMLFPANDTIHIRYGNLTLYLYKQGFRLFISSEESEFQVYCTDPVLHFERTLFEEQPCSVETVQMMVDIRVWYSLSTVISNETNTIQEDMQ